MEQEHTEVKWEDLEKNIVYSNHRRTTHQDIYASDYDLEGMNVTKTHTVEIEDDVIYIDTKVQANNKFLGNFKMEVDMNTRNWENRFAYYVTYGRS